MLLHVLAKQREVVTKDAEVGRTSDSSVDIDCFASLCMVAMASMYLCAFWCMVFQLVKRDDELP